jgi:hypothetical protein
MADSNFRGPINVIGSLMDVNPTATGTTVVASISPLDGPSMFYQGVGWPDIRNAPWNKDNFTPGSQPCTMEITDVIAMDNIPQAASSTVLAAALQGTAGAVVLVTAQAAGVAGVPSIAVGVPIIPVGTSVVTSVLAIDFGFATGTTVAASSTVVVNDNTQFTLGQWIVVGGAGNSAASTSLVTQVVSIATANITGITIAPVAVTAIANAPIGAANQFAGQFIPPATQFGPQGPTASAATPYVVAGDNRLMNPKEMLSRNIRVDLTTTTATTTITVFGYDVWKNPMTEKLTIPSAALAAARTVWGQKAFKYIQSASIQTTAGGTVTLGIGDVFGLPFRADYFPQTEIWWNDSQVAFNNGGFKSAFTTAPALNTSGDSRGTLQVSTNGTGSALVVQTAAVSQGTSRLVVIQNVGVWNTVNGTPNNIVPMFGIAQSTT